MRMKVFSSLMGKWALQLPTRQLLTQTTKRRKKFITQKEVIIRWDTSDFDKAKSLISFLSPDGKFKKYYNPDNKPLSEVQVFGSISILDLKNKIIESLYGYFADEWVRITLPNYINEKQR